ncbi:MAG TPA: flippase-like domain-containing protein, partial [Polyangiaceae bacterium]|nr:flippase-like domain-containing protein [Polyangiaceae bacterium]
MTTQATQSDLHLTFPESRAGRSWRWLPWILGVALLATVIVGALHFSEAQEFARLAERAEPWWLMLAVLLQACTYLAQAQVFRAVARKNRFNLKLGTASLLSLAKLFVDQAVPSAGLSGTVVLANGLAQRGMPRPLVAAGVIVDLASYYVAYVLSLALALVITAALGEASELVVLVSVVFFLFAIAMTVLVLALSGRTARRLPRWVARLRPLQTALGFVQEADPRLAHDPRLLLETSAYQLMIVSCDAASVWVLVRALGSDGSASGVFASFMISSLLRTIGFMPGGLGTYEATSVLTLRMVGVPISAALSATLLFRGLSFWLPMLPGFWFSRRELARGRARQSESRHRKSMPDQPLRELLEELESTAAGLTSAEAARRLAIYGSNEPSTTPLRTKVLGFVRASANPLVAILLVAGAASAVLGDTTDAVIIGGIVVLSALINAWQTLRSERAVKRIQAQIAPTAT